MLEDKKDSLPLADGENENANEIENSHQDEILTSDENLDEANIENEIENKSSEVQQLVELTVEEVKDDSFEFQSQNSEVVDAILESNAEENEDESIKNQNKIELIDYDSISMEDQVESLEKLLVSENITIIKDNVEAIKKSFSFKFNQLLEEKRDEFAATNQDENETFRFDFPLKQKFDTLYNNYRDKKNAHFKSLQTNLKSNLENRLAIVEEIKNLIQSQDSISNSLKQLNDIRERWKNAGAIPKDKYNHVWNNYHFHVENFYDFLHLDREARDIDFKNNLDLKLKIISRVEELVLEENINKSFRELQDLHKIWKEDIGPVSRDHREEIWKKFSDLTKLMHDKKEAFYESFREVENENLTKKHEIISKLNEISAETVTSHNGWLQQVVKIEALREEFFKTGKVPSEVNEATWAKFKAAVKNFNVTKNSFYKDIKKDQNDNLSKKQALVAKANEIKDSDDFEGTTLVMKQIQEEWKQIGHIPRKLSDSLWTEFKTACNHFFERLKNNKNAEDPAEVASFENKKLYLENLRSFELIGDHKTDLDAIKAHIEAWKNLGRVPFNRRHIEGKFNKILDALFEKLSASKKDTDKLRFSNKLGNLSDDSRKLDNEKIFTMRKIDELQNEIFQLENNIQFFQNTKNAKKENSIVTEVRKNIEKHKEELQNWRDKLKQIKEIKTE